MPYVEPRRNQNGEITSYRLVVSAGLDQNGKQIRRRSLWTPPTRGMSEAQMEREATAAAYKFEDQIKKGYNFDNNQGTAFCDLKYSPIKEFSVTAGPYFTFTNDNVITSIKLVFNLGSGKF